MACAYVLGFLNISHSGGEPLSGNNSISFLTNVEIFELLKRVK
jgi:hypothetical protein